MLCLSEAETGARVLASPLHCTIDLWYKYAVDAILCKLESRFVKIKHIEWHKTLSFEN